MLESRISIIPDTTFEVLARSMVLGYKNSIQKNSLMVVSTTSATASSFVQSIVRNTVPDSILCHGIDTLRQKRKDFPECAVLLLPDLEYVNTLTGIERTIRDIDSSVPVFVPRSVSDSFYRTKFKAWVASNSWMLLDIDVRELSPPPVVFGREHMVRYTNYSYDTYYPVPIIGNDTLLMGNDLAIFDGASLYYMAYNLVRNNDDLSVVVTRDLAHKMFVATEWLINYNGEAEDATQPESIQGRETLKPRNDYGYSVYKGLDANQGLVLQYYDENGVLQTPPKKRKA